MLVIQTCICTFFVQLLFCSFNPCSDYMEPIERERHEQASNFVFCHEHGAIPWCCALPWELSFSAHRWMQSDQARNAYFKREPARVWAVAVPRFEIRYCWFLCVAGCQREQRSLRGGRVNSSLASFGIDIMISCRIFESNVLLRDLDCFQLVKIEVALALGHSSMGSFKGRSFSTWEWERF